MKKILWIIGGGLLAWAGFQLGKPTDPAPVISQAKTSSTAASTTTADKAAKPRRRNSKDADLIAYSSLSPAQIAAKLRELGPFGDSESLRFLFSLWMESEPHAAMKFFASFGLTDELKSSIGTGLLEQWANQDAKSAAAYALAELDLPGGTHDRAELWRTLAKFDGAVAFEKGLTSLTGMEEIFSEWSKQNWSEAAAALERIPPGARLEQAAYGVLDQAMKQNPAQALDWVRQLPDSTRAAIGMFGLLNRYEDVSPQIRFSLLGEQLVNFGHNDDVSMALRKARKSEVPASEREAAVSELSKNIDKHVGDDLRNWAKQDATAALHWANEFPDATLRPVLQGQFGQQLIVDGNIAGGVSAMQGLPLVTQIELLKEAASQAKDQKKPFDPMQLPEGPLRRAFVD